MEMSASIGKLAEALAKARAQMGHPIKDKTAKAGSFSYKYADLPAVLDCIHKPLSANGLSIVQTIGPQGTLTSILMHSSGEWVRDTMEINATSQEPQKVGSAITYARRYALCALVGVAADDDDDGASVSKHGDLVPLPPPPKSAPAVASQTRIYDANNSQMKNELLTWLKGEAVTNLDWVKAISMRLNGKPMVDRLEILNKYRAEMRFNPEKGPA